MHKMTRLQKSPRLQVVISWLNRSTKTLEIYDLIWPNEEPNASATSMHVIEVPLLGELSPEEYETFFAVLQAHDLHGSEEMRAAMKNILRLFLKATLRQGLVQKKVHKKV